ncbi:MAG: hypothetical protein JNK70_08925, partial [Phycisphaerae bacterium]|nr:hypothetical protein [Phycisphaerae bacterium]
DASRHAGTTSRHGGVRSRAVCVVIAEDLAAAVRTATTEILDMGLVPGPLLDAAAIDPTSAADHEEQASIIEALERGCSIVLHDPRPD